MHINKKGEVASNFFSTSNFYGLPKVHKSKQINEAIQQQSNRYMEIQEREELTARPIVGGPNCPARPLSQVINIILKLFLNHKKRYVKDDIDFLGKCSRKNNDSTTLVRLT